MNSPKSLRLLPQGFWSPVLKPQADEYKMLAGQFWSLSLIPCQPTTHRSWLGTPEAAKEKEKGALMQRKDARVSRTLATSSFLPQNISVSPTCNSRITVMIWKSSLDTFVSHLGFSGLSRNRRDPVYLIFHSKLAFVCCDWWTKPLILP